MEVPAHRSLEVAVSANALLGGFRRVRTWNAFHGTNPIRSSAGRCPDASRLRGSDTAGAALGQSTMVRAVNRAALEQSAMVRSKSSSAGSTGGNQRSLPKRGRWLPGVPNELPAAFAKAPASKDAP